MKQVKTQAKSNTKISAGALFLVKKDKNVKLCNYPDNYYGDQQCYALKSEQT